MPSSRRPKATPARSRHHAHAHLAGVGAVGEDVGLDRLRETGTSTGRALALLRRGLRGRARLPKLPTPDDLPVDGVQALRTSGIGRGGAEVVDGPGGRLRAW